MPKICAVILAAGRSTRMRSAIPKVLHHICGRAVATYPVSAAFKAGARPVVVIADSAHKRDFEQLFIHNKDVVMAVQKKQLGTGDAVKASRRAVGSSCEYMLVIPGDVPLVLASTLKALIQETVSKDAVCGVLSMEMDDPASYGRIVRDSNGDVRAIVEACDAAPEELMIREVNSSIYCVKVPWVFDALLQVEPKNSQREYYLTDIVKIARTNGEKVCALCVRDASELMGINTRIELAEAGRVMRYRILHRLMLDGVGIQDELHTYIDDGVKIGEDTIIAPHCFIGGATVIGKGCTIDNGVVLKDSILGDGVHIKPYSVIEESSVKNGAGIGPFARLRPDTVIGANARIGNFVEIKRSLIKDGAKANHLSYIGDAVVGMHANVGCGTITCNYDGRKKHKTIIGDEVFIGSDVQFVAPVKIGRGATIGAGSTITDDVPANSLAIARGRQIVKRNWGKV